MYDLSEIAAKSCRFNSAVLVSESEHAQANRGVSSRKGIDQPDPDQSDPQVRPRKRRPLRGSGLGARSVYARKARGGFWAEFFGGFFLPRDCLLSKGNQGSPLGRSD